MTTPEQLPPQPGKPAKAEPKKHKRRALWVPLGTIAAIAAVVIALVTYFVPPKTAGPSDSSTSPESGVSISIAPTPCDKACAARLQVTCALPDGAKPGATVPLTFEINSPQETALAVAVGVYNDDGKDKSTGTGNLDSYTLHTGDNEVTLSTTLPEKMRAGQYEVVAELWQPNRIAQGDTLVGNTCGTFKVS